MSVKAPKPVALLLSALLALGGTTVVSAQDIPQRPQGMTDQQVQQMIQQRGLGDQLRQRIQQSGMTPDQIRARLRSAGYSENLIDAYLGPATPGVSAPPPSVDVLRAASALGFGDFTLAPDSLTARRDSIFMTRSDSLMLDTLDLVIGRDSVPLKRDSLGMLRIDTAAVHLIATRLMRPRIFGMDVFRHATTQFATPSSGPVGPDYQLGPGDELVLILTGDVEQIQELPVTREGYIVIPRVGQISVANLTLGQLREVLYTQLGRVHSGIRRGPNATTHFDVTVTKVRVNQLFVAGDVVRPGAYQVSALGTALNALYQAGGPTDRGSFRDVRVMRGGSRVATVDLYDYLLGGGIGDSARPQSGDIIFVPPHGPRITVEGRVTRPGIYEVKPGEGLRELVRMAGGLTPDAYTGRANVERILPAGLREASGRDRLVLDVDLGTALADGAPAVPLEANDRIRVFGIEQPVRNRVVVRGNVWQPGPVALRPGMRLTDAIEAAGGVRTDAYLGRAHITRMMPDSTRRMIGLELTGLVQPGIRGDSRRGPQAGQPDRDPELMEFDEVTIFSKAEFRAERTVSVFGSVQRPGAIPFRDSMTLRDAVLLAGGLRDEAYLLQAEISRVTGSPDTLASLIMVPLDSSYVVDQSGYLVRTTNRRGADAVLEPYDNVFVRRVPGFSLQRNVVITGEVKFPGRYTLTRPDERVADLVRRAGGMTEAAYVRGVRFYREEQRAGRVGLDLDHALRDPAFRDNIVLLAGDSIHVPPYQPVVVVEGAVNSPVAVAYVPNKDARFYVDRAGGETRRADGKRAYIVQPNGAVMTRGNRVEPGARVVVPEKPNDPNRANTAQVLTTTMAFLASLLSIVVLAKQI